MKTIKNIIGVLLAFTVITIFYSCEDEPDYTPAGKPNSQEVYFPSTNSATIELPSDANSFGIPIARVKTDEALTVSVTASGTDGLYNFPASANFAQGEATSTITFSYDPDAVGFDSYTDVTLSINDETYTSEYGMSEYTVKLGIPAPWESLGDCTFTEDFMTVFYVVSNPTYSVEIQENKLQPGLFRLVNPFGAAYPYNDPGDWDDTQDWYLEINAEDPTAVYMNVQNTGLDWGFGMFRVGSLAGYYMANGNTLEEVKAEGYTGTYQNGVITFPASTMLASMPDKGTGGLYVANANGGFKIVMPGVVLSDYSVDISYLGRLTDAEGIDYATGHVELGENVSSAKVAIIKGHLGSGVAESIIDGSLESITVTESGTFEFTCSESGSYSFAVVTFSEDGEEQEFASVPFRFTSSRDNAETWKTLGMIDYTDDYLAQMYSADPITLTYKVELQESEQKPGIFRLVNPYLENPWNEPGDADTSKDYYMIINATDPAGVYIELQNMGVNWGDGNLYVYSRAAYGMDGGLTLEEVKAQGFCGTYTNGIITFPANTLLCTFEGDTGLYLANKNGGFRIAVPGVAPGNIVIPRSASQQTKSPTKSFQAKEVSKKSLGLIQKADFNPVN